MISLHKGFSLSRQVISFNENWAFLKGDIKIEEVPGSYQQWESVNLPHTWNAFDPFDKQESLSRIEKGGSLDN